MLRSLVSSILGSILLLAAAVPAETPDLPPLIGVDLRTGPAKIQVSSALATDPSDIVSLFDRKAALPASELRLAANAPLPQALQPPMPLVAAIDTKTAPSRIATAQLLPSLRAEAAGTGLVPPTRVARTIRLGTGKTRTASRPRSRQDRTIVLASRGADRNAVVQRLFGPQSVSGPALAYATLPGDPTLLVPTEPSEAPAPPAQPMAGGVAIYDITAKTVTLPSGEKLEAHSGLGAALDDPSYVHLRMRGATPPGTYDLTLRESLFHGVQALRLNPVGGSAAVHGRAGLLAHTFMLGPYGESNGCISFRRYDRFLQAYLRGEIRQVVVVAGSPEGLPGLARRIFGLATPRAPGT